MSDTTDESTTEAVSETSADTSSADQGSSAESAGEAALGDAGKKALDAMKAKWKSEAEARKSLEAEFDAFKAKAEGKEAEHAAAQEAQRVRAEALNAANQRILSAEIKAAAKGVLADPADAYKFLDLSSFEVSDTGDVDSSAITAALDDLVRTKPYLAVQDGKRFQGDADGGTRKESSPSQLTKADVERLAAEGKHDEIAKAKADGRLNTLLGIK